jgi:Capsule polysaccharide biosynthesis protein
LTVSIFSRAKKAVFQRWIHTQNNQRWKHLTYLVNKAIATKKTESAPVIFFNASTRLQAMSQNAAYSFLTNQILRLQGIPTIQFVCKAGMSRCLLGTNRDDITQKPPCAKCMAQSRAVFKGVPIRWFEYQEDLALSGLIEKLGLEGLCTLRYRGVPLGFWATNSVRWVLRRHHLSEDESTIQLMRFYLLSAWNVLQNFDRLAEETKPRAVVIFNGMFFPEAAVRFVCIAKGIKVITHEVGMRPFTAFFTLGEATAYPIQVSSEFQLTSEMDKKLDAYLNDRFQGNFSMAGIHFWPEMKGLGQAFLDKAVKFKHIVPVFTNVVFDTSQVHANTLFPEMFSWLEDVKIFIQKYPDTLFVIRAHPDEHRLNKESRESVSDWVRNSGADQLANVVFVDSREFISSYDLIQRSHFVMVYNSTIGLEAALMGKAVLTAGRARFTQLATAYTPVSVEAYDQKLAEMLGAEQITLPVEFQINARRFLYYQLFGSSLPFESYLKEDGVWAGYTILKSFSITELLPENSKTANALVHGIIDDALFEVPL